MGIPHKGDDILPGGDVHLMRTKKWAGGDRRKTKGGLRAKGAFLPLGPR